MFTIRLYSVCVLNFLVVTYSPASSHHIIHPSVPSYYNFFFSTLVTSPSLIGGDGKR